MIQILQGDWIEQLRTLPDECAQCCVTSPPYYGLRSYLAKDHPLKHFEIGTETTPEEYISKLIAGFKEVWRVLKDDGTLWLNLGDCYSGSGKGGNTGPAGKEKQRTNKGSLTVRNRKTKSNSVGPKNLLGIPWRVAFALQSDGWNLRCDIVWAKRNCMPESVTDRPTRSHEFIFLLTKSLNYFYNHEAIKERSIYVVDGTGTAARKARASEDLKSHPTNEMSGIRSAGFKDASKMNGKHSDKQRGHSRRHAGFNDRWDQMDRAEQCAGMRNKRDVWNVATANFKGAHFAVFSPELIKPCILAGSKAGDTILDPFGGSGTTAAVATEYGCHAITCELNPDYIKLIEQRCNITSGLKL